MPTFRQLEYLVAIADAQNFRRAAAAAHVSQPTLSQQLVNLSLLPTFKFVLSNPQSWMVLPRSLPMAFIPKMAS